MFDRWVADWPKTGKGARVTLVIIALFCFLVTTLAVFQNIQVHDADGALGVIVVMTVFLVGYVIWPYRIAWAVRRRGGNFNSWFVIAIVFSGLFVGIYYLFRWSRRPSIAGAN